MTNVLKDEIQRLNKNYGAISAEKMKELCEVAGVEYRDPSEVQILVEELKASGYVIRISKQNNPSVVGQYLILRKLDGTFIRGYHIYISLTQYEVYSERVDENLNPILITEVH